MWDRLSSAHCRPDPICFTFCISTPPTASAVGGPELPSSRYPLQHGCAIFALGPANALHRHPPPQLDRTGQDSGQGGSARLLQAVDACLFKPHRRLCPRAGQPLPGTVPEPGPALHQRRHPRGTLSRGPSRPHPLRPPTGSLPKTATRRPSVNHHRHRYGLWQDRMLPTADPRLVLPTRGPAGHQGHRHLPHERPGGGPGPAHCNPHLELAGTARAGSRPACTRTRNHRTHPPSCWRTMSFGPVRQCTKPLRISC